MKLLEVKVPAVGESINEASIGEWIKQNGDYVEQNDILVSLETDKANVEVVAEQSGLLQIQAEEGDTVAVGACIAKIDTSASAPAATSSSAAASTPQSAGTNSAAASSAASSKETASNSTQPTQSTQSNGKSLNNGPQAHPDLQKHLSPAVSQVVAQKNLDPQAIKGTGRGGRITKQDAMSSSASTSSGSPASPASSKQGQSERVKMNRIRQRTAERLVGAQHTAAILTTFNEVDMSALMALRNRYKEDFLEKHGVRLGFMGFFVKATIEALKSFPEVNARVDGTDIVYNHFYNVSVAVGTPKGLLVPVIKDADTLSLAQIESSIRHYALKARDGKISIDDLSNGTFTISNGGVYGSLMSTPILNPPQSGILGMHKIEERPVAINGKVEVRPMMYLALSYDHRIVDGKESVGFLVRIKECLEDPSRILLNI